MAILDHVFWSQWKGDKGLSICSDSGDVASTKDPQFFRGFQILCESHFATPLATSLVRTLQLAAAAIGK